MRRKNEHKKKNSPFRAQFSQYHLNATRNEYIQLFACLYSVKASASQTPTMLHMNYFSAELLTNGTSHYHTYMDYGDDVEFNTHCSVIFFFLLRLRCYIFRANEFCSIRHTQLLF